MTGECDSPAAQQVDPEDDSALAVSERLLHTRFQRFQPVKCWDLSFLQPTAALVVTRQGHHHRLLRVARKKGDSRMECGQGTINWNAGKAQ